MRVDAIRTAIARRTRESDPFRCRYPDCPEAHPVASPSEPVTCPTCRDDLGLPALGVG
jgi:hypothetical protein